MPKKSEYSYMFYQKYLDLLGLNVNAGAKIMIRLRRFVSKARKKKDNFRQTLLTPKIQTLSNICPANFLPYHCVLDTLLHEIAHNLHANHSAEFYDLWVCFCS